MTVDEILTVTDRATKMVVLIPCSSLWNAADVADNFWWEVLRYHGLPRSIISDRRPMFVSEFWTELMKFLDIDARRPSPYHPHANGQAERTNQTLKQVPMTLLLSQDETRWPELIVLAEIAINGAPIANTEYSPFYLNFGYHPVFWWDLPDRQEPGPGAKKEAVRGMLHRMKDDWKMVRAAFKKEQDRAAAYADRRRADY